MFYINNTFNNFLRKEGNNTQVTEPQLVNTTDSPALPH